VRQALRTIFCLLLILFCASPNAAPQPVEVDVVMVDYKFIPDHLTFEHGVLYRLHLENHGKETHEFTAPTFFATADIQNREVLSNEGTEILLQPGDSKYILLTPRRTGTFDLTCADHDWFGMVGGITVK
jgi:uncharacterized cupredoxin-like copper-binding protein